MYLGKIERIRERSFIYMYFFFTKYDQTDRNLQRYFFNNRNLYDTGTYLHERVKSVGTPHEA